MADAKLPDWADDVAFILKQAAIDAQTRGEKFTPTMLASLLRLHCAPKRKKGAPAAPKPRPRNEFFDAVADVFGMVINGVVTKGAAARIGKVVAEVREADPTLTPEELKRICQAVRKKFDGATPLAVSLHFHEFSSAAKRTPTAKRDIYTEPDARWRSIAASLYPDGPTWVTPHEWATIKWTDVSTLIRPEILRKL